MTNQEKTAREKISKLTLADLLHEWELTTSINTPEIAVVRGWLMDEFKARNPEAFDAWLEQDEPTDESLKNFMTDNREL